jgi:hypothetical protein
MEHTLGPEGGQGGQGLGRQKAIGVVFQDRHARRARHVDDRRAARRAHGRGRRVLEGRGAADQARIMGRYQPRQRLGIQALGVDRAGEELQPAPGGRRQKAWIGQGLDQDRVARPRQVIDQGG